jgi:SAM-dependent methyltransferase
MTDHDIAQCWDDNADVWTRHVRAGYDVYRDAMNNPAFLAFVGEVAGLDVLDAGCGEGYNTRLFAERGARMTGCDLSPKLIAHAREEEARAPLDIRYEVASMADLAPFADAGFDAVVSTMALMDCDCYEEAVQAFHRVLRPGGLLAYSILHPCFFHHNMREWERDEHGEITGIRLGSYFDGSTYTESWRFGAAPDADTVRPFTIVYTDRTLTQLLNPLSAAGFRLEGIEEPRPTLEACARDARLRKHRLIPHTLLVKARKA